MSAGGDLGYVGQWKRPAGLLTRADVEVKRFETLASSVRDLLVNHTDVIWTREVGEGSWGTCRSRPLWTPEVRHGLSRSLPRCTGLSNGRLLPICCRLDLKGSADRQGRGRSRPRPDSGNGPADPILEDRYEP